MLCRTLCLQQNLMLLQSLGADSVTPCAICRVPRCCQAQPDGLPVSPGVRCLHIGRKKDKVALLSCLFSPICFTLEAHGTTDGTYWLPNSPLCKVASLVYPSHRSSPHQKKGGAWPGLAIYPSFSRSL